MIDIVAYRQRIGTFSQKIRYKYVNSTENYGPEKLFKFRKRLVLLMSAILVFSHLVINIWSENIHANPTETPCTTQSKSVQTSVQLLYTQEIYSWSVWTNLTGNFFARYTNGNGRNLELEYTI